MIISQSAVSVHRESIQWQVAGGYFVKIVSTRYPVYSPFVPNQVFQTTNCKSLQIYGHLEGCQLCCFRYNSEYGPVLEENVRCLYQPPQYTVAVIVFFILQILVAVIGYSSVLFVTHQEQSKQIST